MKNFSVISSTMRNQDLIPAFLQELHNQDPVACAQYRMYNSIPAYVQDDDSDWWGSDDAQWMLEDLFDQLQTYASDGCYFGAHPGDGSDYGYWECEEF